MAAGLAAKVLGMRSDLIRETREQIDGCIDDSGLAPFDDTTNDLDHEARKVLAEYLADWMIERGWVTEHADAGAGSPFEAAYEDD